MQRNVVLIPSAGTEPMGLSPTGLCGFVLERSRDPRIGRSPSAGRLRACDTFACRGLNLRMEKILTGCEAGGPKPGRARPPPPAEARVPEDLYCRFNHAHPNKAKMSISQNTDCLRIGFEIY
jgi:hypothetical protein